MRSGSKPLIILGIFYLLAIIFSTSLAVFTFPGDQVHSSFTLSYLLASTTANLFSYLFAFHGAGILLAFSLFIATGDLKPRGESLIKGAQTTVVVIIIVGVIYALGVTWLLPASRRQTSELLYRTELADELRQDARLFQESRQFARALTALETYVALVGESEETTLEMESLESRVAEQELARAPRDQGSEARVLRSEAQELGPAELVERARRFMEEEDYYSAHYFADLAWRLSEGSRPDARRLASEAWDEITSLALSRAEEQQSDYFQRKRDAYQAFQAREDSPETLIDAYYQFRALSRERPEDPDVRRYLELARLHLQEVSFFIEEAEAVRANPGARGILGVNERSATEWEVFRIGKLVRAGSQEYLYDIEVIRYDDRGEVLFHFAAPYGKMIGATVNMQAISRESAQVRELPRTIRGEPPGELPQIYEIAYSTSELATAATGVQRREEADIVELFALRSLAGALYLPQEPLEVELFGRLADPLLFISLSFLFLGLGYSLRSQYVSRPPALGMLFLPVLPVLAHALYALLGYLFGVVSASVLLSLPWATAVAVASALLFVILFLSLFSVARKTVG